MGVEGGMDYKQLKVIWDHDGGFTSGVGSHFPLSFSLFSLAFTYISPKSQQKYKKNKKICCFHSLLNKTN